MRTKIQAQQALTGYTRRHARIIYTGTLGNNSDVVDVPSREDFVYVQLHGDANQVVEAQAVASFPHRAGIIVAVELVKRNAASRYQVLGVAADILYVNSIWAGTVGEHAEQHQRRDFGAGGFDPLDIYNRALVNLRARAQTTPDMTVYVERGFYFIGGVFVEWTGGNSPAFTAPAGSPLLTVRRCDLLYIGADYALHIVQGAITSGGSLPAYPTTPSPCVPVAYVYLSNMSATITESLILDARVILTASDAAGTAHNLLSTPHGDTVAAAVVAGDVIVGNDTPKWSRLAITVPAANVRNVIGVDNGETKPSWKAIFDATNPQTISGSGQLGSPGTSLFAAHRDHVHQTTGEWSPKAHDMTSALEHTVLGTTGDVIGLTGITTLGLLTPSSNPGATEALLKTDGNGYVTVKRIGAGGAPTNLVTAVNNNVANDGFVLYAYQRSGNFLAYRSGGTPGAESAVAAGNALCIFCGGGWTGTTWATGARVIFWANQNWTDGPAYGSYITIQTVPDGSGIQYERLRLDAPGNVIVGTAALATDASDGFLYIPTCAGAPTGTPTSYTGRVPMVYDSSNHYLYIYSGAWKKAQFS